MDTEYPSPNGRYTVLIVANEMRMSHWVHSGVLRKRSGGKTVLVLGEDLWSTEHVNWREDSKSVTVKLRKYPGNLPDIEAQLDISNKSAFITLNSIGYAVSFQDFNWWLEEYAHRWKKR